MVSWLKKKKSKREEADTHDDFYLPEIQARSRRRRRRRTQLALLALLVLCAAAGLRLVVWTPVLYAHDVEISGNRQLSEKTVLDFLSGRVLAGSVWSRFLGSDNMLAWPSSFSSADLSLLPILKSAEVSKDWRGRKLEIKVVEREPAGVWCLSQSGTATCYWFDADGLALYRAPFVEGNLIPVVLDSARSELKTGDKILPDDQIGNFFSILQVLAAAQVSAKEIRYESQNSAEIKVLTYAGPQIYFSLRFSASGAYSVLSELQKQLSAYDKLQYIDFRTENRAYYK